MRFDTWKLSVLLLALSGAQAQTTVDTFDLSRLPGDSRWKLSGRSAVAETVDGRKAVRLSERAGVGVAWLPGYVFTNGTIELDVRGRSKPVQGSFVGVAFRVVDGATHDAVYFRPFNFRAADSAAHAHAVQYMSGPAWPWQRLREQHPGMYERPIVPELDGDRWFHVRIVVDRPTISVFVDDRKDPVLVTKELSDRTGGSIGLWVGEGSGGEFANLRVSSRH